MYSIIGNIARCESVSTCTVGNRLSLLTDVLYIPVIIGTAVFFPRYLITVTEIFGSAHHSTAKCLNVITSLV